MGAIGNAIGFSFRRRSNGKVSSSKPVDPELVNGILNSLVVHYNINKQGQENIKSTGKLTDYSKNKLDATCKNFDWTTTEFPDEGKSIRLNGDNNCIVAEGLPILEDYTIIAKRRWIDKTTEDKWFCSLGSGDYTSASQSLFWFEGGRMNNLFYTYNKGYKNIVTLPELLSIQSSEDYNGNRINSSDAIQSQDKLFIGAVGENDSTNSKVDLYELLLFDRVLTDEERQWVKENLMDTNGEKPLSESCLGFFVPDNLMVTEEYPYGVIKDSLGGNIAILLHNNKYTVENGLLKSTGNLIVSIENIDENKIKGMLADLYISSTIPGSYINGIYTEGSISLKNRRIIGINNPMTTSLFEGMQQEFVNGESLGKLSLYSRNLIKDEYDDETFSKNFAVRYSTYTENASTHLFRESDKEIYPGEYLLPFETLYLRVDVEEGYILDNYVFDNVEYEWNKLNPVPFTIPEHDVYIIAMAHPERSIENWSAISSISTFGFLASKNKVEFSGSTDGGTMSYILDDTDVTKFTISYTNTVGEGAVYLVINDTQYEVISGQPQSYQLSGGSVRLDFFNLEEVVNFAGTISFSNVD